jgi:predicted ribosomally synthesized peptide with SipW-like signal peptide
MKNNMKKKILVVALVAIVLVMSIASTTIAYFTDDDKSENEFTVGKVDIELAAAFNTAGKIYPTKTISDGVASTEVTSDSETAYVGAILTIQSDNGDVTSIIGEGKIGDTDKDKATIDQIISGINRDIWDVYVSYENKVVIVYFVA